MIKIRKVYVCRSDLERECDLSNTTQMFSEVILDPSQREVQLSKLYWFSENQGKEWKTQKLETELR